MRSNGLSCAPVHNSRAKHCTHAPFRDSRLIEILWIEHGDHRDGADAIKPRPLALKQGLLHSLPVLCIGCDGGAQKGRCTGVTPVGVVVNQIEKLTELLKVDTHLVNQLAQSHLLRRRQLIEIAKVALGIVDGLYSGDAEQERRFLVGDLWSQCFDLFAKSLPGPRCQPIVKLIKDYLQPFRIQSSSLPKLG